jgi:hypothetical protein
MKSRLFLLVLLLLAACAPERGNPERQAARRATARDACVAEELLIDAREKLTVMQPLAGAEVDPRSPMGAARTYARTYHDYAQLRAGSLAYADSALSAKTPADSARFAQFGAKYAVGPAAPGTVEANVAAEYARNFQAIASNPSHYCNQEPLEDEER